jgi:hypothetical protein
MQSWGVDDPYRPIDKVVLPSLPHPSGYLQLGNMKPKPRHA